MRCEDKKGDFLCHCFTGWAGARCEKGKVAAVGSEDSCVCILACARLWSDQFELGGGGNLPNNKTVKVIWRELRACDCSYTQQLDNTHNLLYTIAI